MPQQSSAVTPFSTSPIREYARAAVEAAKLDQRDGIAAWRVANHLCMQLRIHTSRPTAELSQVPEVERQSYLALAQVAIAIVRSIDTPEGAPTAFEIARHEHLKALHMGRANARREARRLGHEMNVYRPSTPGYELATCRRCGAGVTIHIETAGVSLSEQLELRCAQ